MKKKIEKTEVLAKAVSNHIDTTPKPKLLVYAVVGCNLDTEREARYIQRTYLDKQEALDHAKRKTEEQEGTNIVFIPGYSKYSPYCDKDQKDPIMVYEGLDISYHPEREHDGFYHRSHFGNYRCLNFVETIEIW